MKNGKTESVNNSYTEKYNDESYLGLRAKDADRLIHQVDGKISLSKDARILDAGCGSGQFGKAFKKKYKCAVYGMDQNKLALRNAKKNGLIARATDIEKKWPFPKSSFDAVLGVQIIEHLVNPDHFLLEARRVLKKKGLIVLTTPNLAAWFNRLILLFGFQPFFTEVSTVDKTIGISFTRKLTPNRKPLGHLRCFTFKALKEILSLYDFDLIMVKGSAVSYLPRYMSPLDKFFSYFPDLSTDITVVARKK